MYKIERNCVKIQCVCVCSCMCFCLSLFEPQFHVVYVISTRLKNKYWDYFDGENLSEQSSGMKTAFQWLKQVKKNIFWKQNIIFS